jgi:hypothetical protein
MTPSDPETLSGIARSIAGLFDLEGGLSKVSASRGTAAPADTGTRGGPSPPDGDVQALLEAVDALLAAAPDDRATLVAGVRTAAAAVDEAENAEALADAVEALVRGAGDPPDETVVGLARGFLTAGVRGQLVARLASHREEPRWSELVRTCSVLGHEMAAALSEALPDGEDGHARLGLVAAMAAMGEVALPALEDMVEDARWFVARNAVAVLGQSGGKRAVELIISSLAHPDGRVRREALHSLAKVGGEDAGMLVQGMLEDPDPDVRVAAASAAGALNVQRAVKPLISLLEDEADPQVIVGILGALGDLADPGAVPAIEKKAVGSFLSRQPTGVRIAAYRALHAVGTPRAKSLLVRGANDKDASVKAAVRWLLNMR